MINNIAYYRISDNSRNSELNYLIKLKILFNFIKIFDKFTIVIVADNCSNELLYNLKLLKNKIYITNLGNTKSFKFCLNLALTCNKENDIIYFVEDDYYFYHDSQRKVIDALPYFDYVSLYEHPDKIFSENYSNIKLSEFTLDKFSENLRLININEEVWRTSSSTTMTFCTTYSILKKDYKWWYLLSGNNKLPYDKRCWIFFTRPSIIPTRKNILFYFKFNILSFISFLMQRKRLLGIPLIKNYSIHLDKTIEINSFDSYLNEYI